MSTLLSCVDLKPNMYYKILQLGSLPYYAKTIDNDKLN